MEFRDWLIENRASEAKIKNYCYAVERLLAYVKDEGVTEQSVARFINEASKEVGISRRNGYISAIRAYLKYLGKNFKLPKHIKVHRPLPEHISEKCFKEKVIPLLNDLFKDSYKVNMILQLMFYTGLRFPEVCALKRADFNLAERKIELLEKNGKKRVVYFTYEISHLLKKYFLAEPEQINAFNISPQELIFVFNKIRRCFKCFNFSPNLLRHSFACMYVKNGGDVKSLSKLLGDAMLENTMIYAQLGKTLTQADLKKKYDEYIGKEDLTQQEPIISSTLVEEKVQPNSKWLQLCELVSNFIKELIVLLKQKNVSNAQKIAVKDIKIG